MDELIKLFKSLFGEEAAEELEAEFKKAAKEVPEEAMKAIKSALATLNKFKDAMPDDVLGAIKTLSKYASYGYPEAKKSAGADDLAKVGAKINKANLELLTKASELLQQAVDALHKVLDPALAAEPDTKKSSSPLPDVDKWLDDLTAKIKKMVGAQAGDDPDKDKEGDDEDKDVMIARLKKENAALKKRGQPTGLKGQDDLDDEDVKKTGPKWPSLTGQK